MPERFKPELTRRASSPGEPASRYAAPEGQEDPLVELARIVSGPSGFDAARSRREAAPQPAAFDENLESELTSHAAPPAYDQHTGLEPYGSSLDWPAGDAHQSAEPHPEQDEAGFDEFAHMHLRQAPRVESRRGGRGLVAGPADNSWPPINLDQPHSAADSRDPVAAIEHAASVVGEAGGRYGDYYADRENDPLLIEGHTADDGYQPAGDGPDADFSVGRYGEEGFDPLPEYQEEPAPKNRGIGRGVLMAGAAAAVVILGGVGAIAYMSMDGGGKPGAPRVIAADSKPVKVAPAAQGDGSTSTAAANNKLIYDRVDDPNSDKLKAGETPVTTPPRADQRTTEASREISRIILPDSTGAGAATGASGAPPAGATNVDTSRPASGGSAGSDGPPIGAKKVRTVVVRPDGTIISSGPSAGTDATASAATAGSGGTAGRPAAGTGTPATGTGASGGTTRSNSNNTGGTAGAAPTTNTTGASGSTGTAATANRTTTTTVTSGQGVTTATSNTAASNAANANQRVATRETTGGPISLVPNTGAGSGSGQGAARTTGGVAAVTAGADGFVVQVTSQKSESAATAAYRDLQKKFPSLLGNREPDMQRVDLGARGVFFRVRVGPVGSQEAASGFCDSLKGAGADCVVVRN